jgi:hypothetical protein
MIDLLAWDCSKPNPSSVMTSVQGEASGVGMKSTPQPWLLTLPLEIRQQIYDYLLDYVANSPTNASALELRDTLAFDGSPVAICLYQHWPFFLLTRATATEGVEYAFKYGRVAFEGGPWVIRRYLMKMATFDKLALPPDCIKDASKFDMMSIHTGLEPNYSSDNLRFRSSIKPYFTKFIHRNESLSWIRRLELDWAKLPFRSKDRHTQREAVFWRLKRHEINPLFTFIAENLVNLQSIRVPIRFRTQGSAGALSVREQYFSILLGNALLLLLRGSIAEVIIDYRPKTIYAAMSPIIPLDAFTNPDANFWELMHDEYDNTSGLAYAFERAVNYDVKLCMQVLDVKCALVQSGSSLYGKAGDEVEIRVSRKPWVKQLDFQRHTLGELLTEQLLLESPYPVGHSIANDAVDAEANPEVLPLPFSL